MKLFGQLKKALLELVAGTPADSEEARVWYDVTPNVVAYEDDVGPTALVSTTRAQNITGVKTMTSPVLNSPSIVTPSRLDVKQGTKASLVTYASTAANGQLCFATVEKKMYQVIDGALAEVGGGGAGGDADTIHLINVDDIDLADIDLTGRNADGDGGGTITASSLTLSTTAADLLTGDVVIKYNPDADGTNDYWGFTKSIALGYRGGERGFQFNYKNNSTTIDNDFRFWAKIKDGASAGQINYFDMEAFYNSNNTGTIWSTGNFIPLDCTEVEFGWQCQSSTTTVELMVSNILVTQALATHNLSNTTDWEAFTPSSNWITNTTHSAFYRRVGDSIEVSGTASLTGAPDAVQLTIDLPTGLTFDAAKMVSNDTDIGNIGIGMVSDAGTGKIAAGHRVYYVDSNSIRIRDDNSAYSNTVPITWANGDQLAYRYTAPITGWSATSENVVTPMTAPKWVDITVTDSNWTTGTARGMYYTDANNVPSLKFRIRGAYSSATAAPNLDFSGVTFADYNQDIGASPLLGTAIVEFAITTTSNSKILINANASDTLWSFSGDVELDSKPTWADPVSSRYLAAVPSVVGAKYATDSGQSIAYNSIQTIIFEDKIYDRTGSFNPTTGIYTVPSDGIYAINANAVMYGSGWELPEYANLRIIAGGNNVCTCYWQPCSSDGSGSDIRNSMVVSASVELSEGDTIYIQIYQLSDATLPLVPSGSYNTVSIVKVGN